LSQEFIDDIGYVVIFIALINILVNLLIVIHGSSSQTVHAIKLYCIRKKKQTKTNEKIKNLKILNDHH